MSLQLEVEKFKQWALTYPVSERSGEWECDYNDWPSLYHATIAFLASAGSEQWTDQDKSDLLYAIARDNEIGDLVKELAKTSAHLLALAREAVNSDKADAKWQLAVQLGDLSNYKDEAESLLLIFVTDVDEYVSRRALLALASLKSEKTESLAERAWETGLEYQRIAALWALKEVSSEKLPAYIHKALEDGRKYVVRNAREVAAA